MATEILEEPRTKSFLFDLRHRITVEEYHRMIDSGAFGPEPRVELLEGVIVDKMTKKPPHVLATDLVEELLHHLLPRGSGFCITMGNPITIEERDGEPEPDAMVLRGSREGNLAVIDAIVRAGESTVMIPSARTIGLHMHLGMRTFWSVVCYIQGSHTRPQAAKVMVDRSHIQFVRRRETYEDRRP